MSLSLKSICRFIGLLAVNALLLNSGEAKPSKYDTGRTLYMETCASCHGDNGEGTADEYDEPLYGDSSIQSLSRLIHRTMPDDDPELCLDEDARLVAEYIHQKFYSIEARYRNGLIPRVELARLTVPQHRNALTDIVAHFTPKPELPIESEQVTDSGDEVQPGLRAQYYQGTRKKKTDRLDLERIDQSMSFDFAECVPDGMSYIEHIEPIPEDATDQEKKKILMYRKDGPRYSILWEGAFIARESGIHEFRITTENGVRLFLNNDYSETPRKFGKMNGDGYDYGPAAKQGPTIDAWVSSSKGAARTARVYLLEGRQYPLRLEFFKSREKTGSLKFELKPPHGAWAVLDSRNLNTATVPRIFATQASFPADDRSRGYERGSSVSREWHSATTQAALETANEVINRLPILAGYDRSQPDNHEILGDFLVRFASRAFRRPLTGNENRLYKETLFLNETNPEASVRRAILLILNSPHFLYTDITSENEAFSQYNTAARLSFALWDSIPDQALLDAAANGQLAKKKDLKAQISRMLADQRAKSKLRSFFHHFLEIEERDLSKDKELFPEFDAHVIADLRYSLESFIEQSVWNKESDYRQLLLADYLVLNEDLLDIYKADHEDPAASSSLESKANFENIVFSSRERSGLLTHPYLLSAFAYHNNTSPIHRGVFLTRNIVGRSLKSPPDAVAFNDAEFDPEATMREKVTELTRDQSCMSCHSVINPLGFALENYDAIGRWRTSDNRKTVDSKSEYITESGKTTEIESARDIAKIAISSKSAPRAFIRQLFYHITKQSPAAYDAKTLEKLRRYFIRNNYSIQKLVSKIAEISAARPPSNPSDQSKS